MAMMNQMDAAEGLCADCGMPGKPCTCDAMDATSKDCNCDMLPEPESDAEDAAEGQEE